MDRTTIRLRIYNFNINNIHFFVKWSNCEILKHTFAPLHKHTIAACFSAPANEVPAVRTHFKWTACTLKTVRACQSAPRKKKNKNREGTAPQRGWGLKGQAHGSEVLGPLSFQLCGDFRWSYSSGWEEGTEKRQMQLEDDWINKWGRKKKMQQKSKEIWSRWWLFLNCLYFKFCKRL